LWLTRGGNLALGWLVLCAAASLCIHQALRLLDHSAVLVQETSALVLIGFLVAQVAWVAIWSVLAPWSLLRRGLFCLGGTVILVICASEIFHPSRLDFWLHRNALVLPLFALAVQCPLWIARGWFGWHLRALMDASSTNYQQPVSIRGLMTCTGVIACALGAAHISGPLDYFDCYRS
jgi:hypothetical protein